MSSVCDLAANVTTRQNQKKGFNSELKGTRERLPAVLEMFDRKNILVHETLEPCLVVFTVWRIKVNIFHSYLFPAAAHSPLLLR